MNPRIRKSHWGRSLTIALAIAAVIVGYVLEGAESGAFFTTLGLCWACAAIRIGWPSHRPFVVFALGATLILLGFVLGFWTGRTVRYARNEFGDMHRVVWYAIWAWPIVVAIGGLTALLLNRSTLRRLKPGAYCPTCSYHLVGVQEHRCPECGEAFTLEQLGVTEEQLRARAPRQH